MTKTARPTDPHDHAVDLPLDSSKLRDSPGVARRSLWPGWSMMALRRIHRFSATAVGAYALVHLANHLAALQGVERHIAFMRAVRQVTRLPAVEALLLAGVILQLGSGLLLALRRRIPYRTALARLQAMSGLYLVFFLLVHVISVFFGRGILGLDTNFYFAAAGLLVTPYYLFFVPYYGLAVAALVMHLTCAMLRLLPPKISRAWRDGIGYVGIAGGVLLAALIVATFSGVFYPIALPSAYLATFR
jgi:hypothetical protein